MKRLLISLIFLFSVFSYGQVYKATERKGDIKIDGKLDEVDWQRADVYSGFHYLKSVAEGKPKVETNFRILKDRDAIYVGIYCQEPYMNKLREEFLPRDSSFWERDSVEIFFDPEGKGFNYYQFAVTVSNAQWDAYWIEGGPTSGGYYSAIWESATYKGDDFWSAEVKIPLGCFFNTPKANFSTTWLMNVTRERFPEPELLTWSELDKRFLEPKNFRKMQDMPIKNCDMKISKAETDIKDEKLKGDLIMKVEAGEKTGGEIKVYRNDKEIGSKKVNFEKGENVIKVEDVDFGKEGKEEIGIVVLRDKDILLSAIEKISVNYEKVQVELTKPFYSNCIFPEQKVDNIEGKIRINIPEEKLKDSKVRIELKGENFSREVEKRGGKEVEFKIKSDDLKIGEYSLLVDVIRKGGLSEKKEIKIRKLGKPEKGSYVYIDENLNLVVNGKPMFPLGWYAGGSYLVSQAIRNKYGDKPNSKFVNIWGPYLIGVEVERMHQVRPEVLKKLGSTYAELEKIAAEERVRMQQDVEPNPMVYKFLEMVIEEVKKNPDIWIYDISEEPECRGVNPGYVKHLYNFLKEKDPYHPVMVITRDPKDYTECADILNPHPYLNPSVDDSGKRKMESVRQVKNVIREVYDSGKNKISAWCTPQAFTYRYADRFADYPTFDEFNCMIWTSIVNGAKGFTPYIYHDQLNCLDLRLGADFIYETISHLEEFLLTHPDDKLSFEDTNKDIDVLIKKKDEKILLIAVNMTDKDQNTEIYSKGLKGIKKLYGYRENSEIDVKDGKIKLSFYPYQVHILSYPVLDQGLKKVEELKKEISEIKEGFKKKGNILYGRGNDIEFNSSDTYIPNPLLFSLCDGMTDTYGWAAVVTSPSPENPSFVEMKFLNFVPEFKRLKIYTATIEDMDVLIWRKGCWDKIAEVRGNKEDVIELKFNEKMRTVKMKLVMTKAKPGTKPELYEVEMYEE